jgi:hypothetical protein
VPVDETDAATMDDSTGSLPSTTVDPLTSSSGSPSTTAEPSTSDATSTGEIVGTTESSGSTGEVGLDPDLVAWYRFEEPALAQATDDTPNALHGMCALGQCGTPIEGVVGQAVHLDGLGDHFRVPDAEVLHTIEAWTIALWLRSDAFDLDATHTAIAKPVGTLHANSYEIFFNRSEGEVFLYLGASDLMLDEYIEAVPMFGRDTWVHVAATWDGMVMRLFFDAAQVGIVQVAASGFDEHDLFLGADQNLEADPSSFFNGSLDEIRIYSRALDESEIAEIYALEVAGGG